MIQYETFEWVKEPCEAFLLLGMTSLKPERREKP